MSIVSGFKKVKNYIKETDGYKLLSRWTSSDTVDVNGKTLTEAINGLNTSINGKANSVHTHGNGDITSLDASKITSGTIDIDRLPQGALDRLIKVADDTARFKLTTNDVQLGDSVKVTSTKKMYIVVDETKLSSEDGYEPYTADSATSVPWSGVTGKPSTYTPSSHTHTKSQITDFPTSMPANGGNSTTVNGHTVKSDVPENAVFTDTVYDDTEVKERINELNSNLVALEEDCETLFCDRNILKNISHSVENNGSWRFEANPLRLALLANPIKGFTPNRSYRIYLKAYANNTSGVPILQVKYTDDTTDDILVKATSSTEYNLTTNASKSIKEIITSYWDNCFFYIEKLEIYGHDVGKQLTDSNESLSDYGMDNKASGWLQKDSHRIVTPRKACNAGNTVRFIAGYDISYFGGSVISFLNSSGTQVGENVSITKSDFTCTVPSGATAFEVLMYKDSGASASGNYPYSLYVDNAIDKLKNDLDKLNSLPIGSIIQIEAAKNNIETTTQKYGWQYLGTSKIECNDGSLKLLVTNVYRKNN